MAPAILAQLEAIVGPDNVLRSDADRWPYGYDNSRRHGQPGAVVRPATHEQVAAIAKLCHRNTIPLVCRGRGTGTAGAAVPGDGALVLSFERMDQILRVDPDNRLLVVQPGVTNRQVQEAASGFFWPPDPTSSDVCTIGGNLACNAAGPRAVKYGTPRENTLGLRVVTGTGDELRTGTYTTKGVVGYDLTRLLIGSEGTLGIITEAVLKLTPRPEGRRTLQAVYDSIGSAARAVSRVMAQPVTPCALEFMDNGAIDLIRHYPGVVLPDAARALLMIEVDGPENCLDGAVRAVEQAAQGPGCIQLSAARTREEVERLWATRKALSPAQRNVAPKKINEDVVVPVSRIPELVEGLEELGRKHRITIVNFGHAGNGNIHVNLLVNADDTEEMTRADTCLSAVFDLVLSLEGTLSGEHGIGLVKREFVKRELDAVALSLMHGIKTQFDPAGILNPGKKLPVA